VCQSHIDEFEFLVAIGTGGIVLRVDEFLDAAHAKGVVAWQSLKNQSF